MPPFPKNKRWLLAELEAVCEMIKVRPSGFVLTVAPRRYITLTIGPREIICVAPNIGPQKDYRNLRKFCKSRQMAATPERRDKNGILRFVLPNENPNMATTLRDLLVEVFGFRKKDAVRYLPAGIVYQTNIQEQPSTNAVVRDQSCRPRSIKTYFKVSITEIFGAPASSAPRSDAIVELRVTGGDVEKAKRLANHIAEVAYSPIIARRKIKKVSYAVTVVEKPVSMPRMFSIIEGVKTWFILDE